MKNKNENEHEKPNNNNNNNNNNNIKNMESSIMGFVLKLQQLLDHETYDYSFYDFERETMKEKNKMYITIEQMKNNKNIMKHFCDEINSKLLNYDIMHICNIICGKNYKYKNRIDVPIQISDGYYYSFTVVCKKKSIYKF